MDDREVEIEVEEGGGGLQAVPGTPGMPGGEQLGQQIKDLFGQMGRRKLQLAS